MADVLLSGATRSNLANLQQTAQMMAQVQGRLATGRKVNSALDNPTNYFMAASLNRRASDLSGVLDGMASGLKTLEAVDASITALTNLVTSAQSVANSALASVGTTARRTGTVANLTAASSFVTTAGKTILIGDGTGTTGTYTTTASTTVQNVVDLANNTAGLKVKASLSSDGRIKLEATGTNTIVVGGTIVAGELSQFGLTAATTAAGTLNTSRSALAAQFDSTISQVDQLASDASFNGVNLLSSGSLKVSFNETGTTALTISGVSDSSAGLGLAVSANTFQTDKDINDALNTLKSALTTLQGQAAAFASNVSIVQSRQDFTKSMIDTLKGAANDLVVADTNEEGANLLALQTRQELSTTALSLAAQSDQSVLRLFR